MRLIHVLGACAALAVSVAAPAHALTVENMPRNADGSARFADPDAMFDQQAEAYENGRWGGVMAFGEGAHERTARERAQAVQRDLRDPGDHTCVDNCSSVDVDGVLMLRHDDSDQR